MLTHKEGDIFNILEEQIIVNLRLDTALQDHDDSEVSNAMLFNEPKDAQVAYHVL